MRHGQNWPDRLWLVRHGETEWSRDKKHTGRSDIPLTDKIRVLLTSPGERVMRPDFGSGLLQLVFEPNSIPVAATTQTLVQASLQQHLSHLIAVIAVQVDVVQPEVAGVAGGLA